MGIKVYIVVMLGSEVINKTAASCSVLVVLILCSTIETGRDHDFLTCDRDDTLSNTVIVDFLTNGVGEQVIIPFFEDDLNTTFTQKMLLKQNVRNPALRENKLTTYHIGGGNDGGD